MRNPQYQVKKHSVSKIVLDLSMFELHICLSDFKIFGNCQPSASNMQKFFLIIFFFDKVRTIFKTKYHFAGQNLDCLRLYQFVCIILHTAIHIDKKSFYVGMYHLVVILPFELLTTCFHEFPIPDF